MSSHNGDRPSIEIKVTPAMLDVEENVISCELGGCDLGGFFSPRELAEKVFLAMAEICRTAPAPVPEHNRPTP